jgi:hypothetical protein
MCHAAVDARVRRSVRSAARITAEAEVAAALAMIESVLRAQRPMALTHPWHAGTLSSTAIPPRAQ